MGMTLQSSWQCDRCDKVERVNLGEVPQGWKAIAPLPLFVDPNNNEADTKLPRKGHVKTLCLSCKNDFDAWFGSCIDQTEVADSAESVDQVAAEPEATISDDHKLAAQIEDLPVVGEENDSARDGE